MPQASSIQSILITIGDELLMGQVIDTNSAFISQQLNSLGIGVKRRIAIGDDRAEILAALSEAAQAGELIIVTGGLGPTRDDITKQTVCEFFGSRLVMNDEILEMVKALFEKLKRPMIEVNRRQAEVPHNCFPLKNFNGTAPGMWFVKNGNVFAFLPGVPFEMKPMLVNQVLPKVREHFATPFILHRTIHTQGLGESFIAEKIRDIEDGFPPGFKLAYLPHYSIVRLRISGTGSNEQLLRQQSLELSSRIEERIAEYVFGFDDTSIEKEIGVILQGQQKTLAVAESVTGGLIAHKITSVPGSSDYFKGGAVTYTNAMKEKLLGVPASILASPGPVSLEAVRQMVNGALDLFEADYALAVSGFAGPTAGATDQPVGTVWAAAGSRHEVVARELHFARSRDIIIEYAAITALALLWRFMAGKKA